MKKATKAQQPAEKPLRDLVVAFLRNEIRPELKADGGNAELVSLSKEGIVRMRLSGICKDCTIRRGTCCMVIGARLKALSADIKGFEIVE